MQLENRSNWTGSAARAALPSTITDKHQRQACVCIHTIPYMYAPRVPTCQLLVPRANHHSRTPLGNPRDCSGTKGILRVGKGLVYEGVHASMGEMPMLVLPPSLAMISTSPAHMHPLLDRLAVHACKLEVGYSLIIVLTG